MDNIFGVGLPELILILVIAGMVMGPERIVRAARSFGQLTAKMQAISRSFIRQLNAELESVDQGGQLKGTAAELNNIRREIAELQRELLSVTAGLSTETQTAHRALKKETENAILPPELRKLITPVSSNTVETEARNPHPKPAAISDGPGEYNPAQDSLDRRPRRVDIADDPE